MGKTTYQLVQDFSHQQYEYAETLVLQLILLHLQPLQLHHQDL